MISDNNEFINDSPNLVVATVDETPRTFGNSFVSSNSAGSSAKNDLDLVFKKVVETVDDKINKEYLKFFEVIGIFVGLFAFISTNITLFSRVKDLTSALIFTLLLFLLMSTFLFAMDLILTGWKENRGVKICFLLLIWVIIIPCIFFASNNKDIQLNPIASSEEFRFEIETIFNEQINRNTDSLKTNFVQTSEFRDWKAIKSASDAEYNIKQEVFKKCLNSAINLEQLKTCVN